MGSRAVSKNCWAVAALAVVLAFAGCSTTCEPEIQYVPQPYPVPGPAPEVPHVEGAVLPVIDADDSPPMVIQKLVSAIDLLRGENESLRMVLDALREGDPSQ